MQYLSQERLPPLAIPRAIPEKIPSNHYHNASDFYRAAAPREQHYINSFGKLLNVRGYYSPKLSSQRSRKHQNRPPRPVRQQQMPSFKSQNVYKRNRFYFSEVNDDGEDFELFQQSKPTATITLENGVSFEVETSNKWLPSKLNFLFAMPEDEFSNYDFTRWQTNTTTKVLQFLRSNFHQERYTARVKYLESCFMERLNPATLRRLKNKKEANSYWLKLNVSHKALDRLNLGAILHSDEIKAVCPNLKTLSRTRICHKLGTTVGDIVLNATSVGNGCDEPRVPKHPAAAMDSLESDIAVYVDKAYRNTTDDIKLRFKNVILKHLHTKLSRDLSFLDSPLSSKALQELSSLQNSMVLLKVDKGQHPST